MIYLSSDTYKENYYVKSFSKPFFFTIFIYSFVIVVPIALCYQTNSFWREHEFHYEKPIINLQPYMIIQSQEANTVKLFNNFPQSNNLITQDSILGSTIQILKFNQNAEQYTNKYEVRFNYPSSANDVNQLDVFLFLDYGFNDKIRLQMQDMVHFQAISNSGISKAVFYGDLGFNQVKPLPQTKIPRNLYNESTEVIAYNLLYNFQDMTKYFKNRNETIQLENQVNFIESGYSNQFTEIVIQLSVPRQQQIIYTPKFIENFKFFWLQFLSLMVPIYLVCHQILYFVIRNKLYFFSTSNNYSN